MEATPSQVNWILGSQRALRLAPLEELPPEAEALCDDWIQSSLSGELSRWHVGELRRQRHLSQEDYDSDI